MAILNVDPAATTDQLKQALSGGKFEFAPAEVRGAAQGLLSALEKFGAANSKAKSAIASFRSSAESEDKVGLLQSQAQTMDLDNTSLSSNTSLAIQGTSEDATNSADTVDNTEHGNTRLFSREARTVGEMRRSNDASTGETDEMGGPVVRRCCVDRRIPGRGSPRTRWQFRRVLKITRTAGGALRPVAGMLPEASGVLVPAPQLDAALIRLHYGKARALVDRPSQGTPAR